MRLCVCIRINCVHFSVYQYFTKTPGLIKYLVIETRLLTTAPRQDTLLRVVTLYD